MLSQSGIVSIDQQDDEGLSVGDRLAVVVDGHQPDDQTFQLEIIRRLRGLFESLLNERERYILISHYGLDGTDARTMADIGKSMGLSRERVRQIEVGALSRLRKVI